METVSTSESLGDDESAVDPRIKVELETLNAAADSVNKLENELQMTQMRFIRDKTIFTQQLDTVRQRIGDKHISRAQPFYELMIQSNKLQSEVRRSAEKYQAACMACDKSKQTLIDIEQNSSSAGDAAAPFFSADKLESLNRANEEFMMSEKTKLTCERDHQLKTQQHLSLQQQIAAISKDIPKTLKKAKPFYDQKEQLESKLKTLKQYADDIALALTCNKQRYQLALDNLESISDEVHEQRRLVLPPRTPGVGAEAVDDLSSWPSVNIDVVGMHFEAESSAESHHASSYSDTERSVGSTSVEVVDKFGLVNASDRSFSSHKTAEEIIRCASETAALKHLSETSLLTSATEAVTCTEIPYRDNEIDGAEDSQQNACELSDPVPDCDAAAAAESSYNVISSLPQKTVAVAALPLGVYITKPAAPADDKASATQASKDDNIAQNCERDSRQLQLQKQFPILHDLSQRPQQL